MGKFIVGVIIGILLVPAVFYLYVRSGYAPVATSAPPMPFERFFAKTALHATLNREAPKTHTTTASRGELLAGVQVYRDNCAVCHGLPGKPRSPVARGEFPPPPQLFEPAHMVTNDPVGVTYWKVKHGIRLTGMPGFQTSLTDEEIWNVSLLLANADKLPADVSQTLQAPLTPALPAKPSAPPATKPDHGQK
ncbi:MAG: c-type cytochrome [Acidobacteria bacterium]|nr:c-type cytochrome [Acidobacteriota bacterium]